MNIHEFLRCRYQLLIIHVTIQVAAAAVVAAAVVAVAAMMNVSKKDPHVVNAVGMEKEATMVTMAIEEQLVQWAHWVLEESRDPLDP